MPKVLHVFKIYYPEFFGGVQRAIYDIADGVVDHGYDSTVFALSAQPNPKPFDIGRHQAVTFNQQLYVASTGISFSAVMPFRQLAAASDIIHYHFPWPFMDALHLISTTDKPALVTYHSDVVKQSGLLQLYKPLMHCFLNSVDQIVATSPNYLETSRTLQRYREKTVTIPLGISDRERRPDPALVEKWRSKVGDAFFLFLGALRYYKGLPVLLAAARRTGLPVVIGGTGNHKDSLEADAPDNVIFIGHYSDDDRDALLSLAKAFVFPSNERSEAFGISLLEAARASLPMICCEIGTGTTYVNKNEVTGLVIPPNDSTSLGGAMQRLNADQRQCERFGDAARKRFEGLFTARQMAADYAAQYDVLLKTNG